MLNKLNALVEKNELGSLTTELQAMSTTELVVLYKEVIVENVTKGNQLEELEDWVKTTLERRQEPNRM